ncbi:MAG: SMC-Scp complex subunit ScpB [Geobacter sp.]|nr:SMC-Scp complex subunit ScpB [Geobacter sp.]
MSHPTLKAIIEGLLFVADGPLSLDQLTELLHDYDRASVRLAVQELRDDYEQRGAGVHLVEVAGGWQLRTIPELMPFLSRMVKGRPARFSQSALETLAIIAYRQPITRQEIEYLRGVDTGAVIKTLLEKKLVRILGKKDIPGRPIIYGTTREFLEVFNLKDLKGLPTLREISALDEMPVYEVQEELPLGSEQRGAP